MGAFDATWDGAWNGDWLGQNEVAANTGLSIQWGFYKAKRDREEQRRVAELTAKAETAKLLEQVTQQNALAEIGRKQALAENNAMALAEREGKVRREILAIGRVQAIQARQEAHLEAQLKILAEDEEAAKAFAAWISAL